MRFRLLMPLSLRDDPGLAWGQREELEEHLHSCRACADEYEQDRQLSGLLRQCAPAGPGAFASREQDVAANRPDAIRAAAPMTTQEGWEDLLARSPSLAAAWALGQQRRKRMMVFAQAGRLALAAGMLIAVGVVRMSWHERQAPVNFPWRLCSVGFPGIFLPYKTKP